MHHILATLLVRMKRQVSWFNAKHGEVLYGRVLRARGRLLGENSSSEMRYMRTIGFEARSGHPLILCELECSVILVTTR